MIRLFLSSLVIHGVTPLMKQRDCHGSIRHVHLAFGPDPSSSMTVSFASLPSHSGKSIHGAILIGKDPRNPEQLVIESEEPIFYTSLQPKNGKNYSSPYQHHITITGLSPQTTYYYKCITRESLEDLLEIKENVESGRLKDNALIKLEQEEESLEETEDSNRRRLQAKYSQNALGSHRRLTPEPYDSTQCKCPDPDKVRYFSTMARSGHGNQKIAVIGDIGQFLHSEETLDHLRRHHGDVIDSIILAGDIAYPDSDHHRWDTFFDFLDDYPLVEYIPLHITPGNHDIDKAEKGSDIFLSYETRFRMPRIQPAQLGIYNGPIGLLNMDRPPYPLNYDFGNAYYTFSHGRTHQIFLSSYSALEPGSNQYEWLVRELKTINRRKTPWVIVTYHVPIYNTFQVHQKDTQLLKMREHIEPLLVENKVNLIFNGHIHAYLRTKPVAYGKVTKNGPIHIVMGAGGRAAQAAFLQDEPEDWVEIRDGTIYGYGLLEICNRTHARWDWVHTGQESDHNAVYKEDVILPPGGRDYAYFVNQYYMKD
jgi:acid phosphatase type 7